MNKLTRHQEDPLGFLPLVFPWPGCEAQAHRQALLSLIGMFGLMLAFGHSILAMSGEETMPQVYREVESPKLRNFQKAASS